MSFRREHGSAHMAWVGRPCWRRGRGVDCGQLSSRLLDDTLFIPQVPDIYFEMLHHTPGAPMENRAQQRKLYYLIIATHGILLKEKWFFHHQAIEQLWSNLNPDSGVLLITEIGTPAPPSQKATSRTFAKIFNRSPPDQGCRWLRQPPYRAGARCCNCPVQKPKE
ncbi:hypothetical protein HOY82DRAFT_163805 [Tuber indicum]|nr:hypothetical protein HOY82DRAFT_163805 [Tuber indicum]